MSTFIFLTCWALLLTNPIHLTSYMFSPSLIIYLKIVKKSIYKNAIFNHLKFNILDTKNIRNSKYMTYLFFFNT